MFKKVKTKICENGIFIFHYSARFGYHLSYISSYLMILMMTLFYSDNGWKSNNGQQKSQFGQF